MYALALLKPLPAKGIHVFPNFAEQVLPPGLKAVFFCGMLGTILSAMVGYTLVSGATLGREVLGRLRPLTDAQTTLWTRVGFGVACFVAVALAVNIASVVDLWYAWGGCVIGALLIPVGLAYAKRTHLRPPVVAASMILAFGCSFAWLIQSQRTNNTLQEVAWLRIGDGWRFALPPIPDAVQAQATDTVRFSLGTLLPGLVISALVIGLGQAMYWRKSKA